MIKEQLIYLKSKNILCSSTYPELLGTYVQDFDASTDHPAYSKDGHTIFFLDDVLHHYQGWTLSDSFSDIGPVTNEGEAAFVVIL